MSFVKDADSSTLAGLYELTTPGGREILLREQNLLGNGLFAEILRQLDDLGAASAVAEYRYIDPDYRNEHAKFYASTFRRYPSIATRLHFFAEPVDDLDGLVHAPEVLAGMTYLGYLVRRPVPAAPIGRALLAGPTWASAELTCAVCERVSLFGSRLTVTGVPFMSQDGELGVCAHASAWITAQQHHLRHNRPRRLPGDIADAVPAGPGLGRTSPASSVSVHQLSDAYSRLGLAPIVNWKQKLPAGEDLDALLCRYLNSALPVTVTCGNHTFVVVGYAHVPSYGPEFDRWQQRADAAASRWKEANLDRALLGVTRADAQASDPTGVVGPAGAGSAPVDVGRQADRADHDVLAAGRPDATPDAAAAGAGKARVDPNPPVDPGAAVVFFLCQDDQAGPYQVRRFDNIGEDNRRTAPWEYFLVPLPDKVYLSAEDAESFAHAWAMGRLLGSHGAAAELKDRMLAHKTFWRTTLTTSNDFKAQLPDRGATAEVVAHYRGTRMARLVYVCELIERDERDERAPSVVGEVLVDATSHHRKGDALAWRLPGMLGSWDPDTDTVQDDVGPAETDRWHFLSAQPEVSGSSP